jgi:hypothetical protein
MDRRMMQRYGLLPPEVSLERMTPAEREAWARSRMVEVEAPWNPPPGMAERYGLDPGSAPGAQPAQMDPELMKRYGLRPAPAPAANAPEEEVEEESP